MPFQFQEITPSLIFKMFHVKHSVVYLSSYQEYQKTEYNKITFYYNLFKPSIISIKN